MDEVDRKRLVLAWAPACAYMALIFVVSSMPLIAPPIDDFPFRDKGVHFVEYGLLGLLVARAAFLTWRDRAPWRLWAFAVLFATAFGVTDELHQAFVPNRSADLLDLVADGFGAASGAALFALWARGRR